MNRATFAALLTSAAIVPPAAANADSEPGTLSVGCVPAETFALVLYAQDQGFLKQVGANVDITVFPASSAITAAVIGGSLDIGCSNWGSIANAHSRGLPISVISPGGVYTSASPTTLLAVAKASPLQTAKDLNGKVIAVSTLRDSQQAAMMKWSDLNGGDSKTLKFIELPPAEMGAALAAARVDAAVILEPALSAAKNLIRPIGKPYDAISNPMLITAYYGTNAVLERKAAVVHKFIAAMKATAIWANANHAASAAILEKYAKIPAASIVLMNRCAYTDVLDVASIQPTIDVMVEYKFLANRFLVAQTFWPQLAQG